MDDTEADPSEHREKNLNNEVLFNTAYFLYHANNGSLKATYLYVSKLFAHKMQHEARRC